LGHRHACDRDFLFANLPLLLFEPSFVLARARLSGLSFRLSGFTLGWIVRSFWFISSGDCNVIWLDRSVANVFVHVHRLAAGGMRRG
jgi:hypothetical protein